jgi:hypothetical protein
VGEKPQTSSGAIFFPKTLDRETENPLSAPSHSFAPLSLSQKKKKNDTQNQVLERREEMDWHRHIAFSTFGIIYLVSSCRFSRRAT